MNPVNLSTESQTCVKILSLLKKGFTPDQIHESTGFSKLTICHWIRCIKDLPKHRSKKARKSVDSDLSRSNKRKIKAVNQTFTKSDRRGRKRVLRALAAAHKKRKNDSSSPLGDDVNDDVDDDVDLTDSYCSNGTVWLSSPSESDDGERVDSRSSKYSKNKALCRSKSSEDSSKKNTTTSRSSVTLERKVQQPYHSSKCCSLYHCTERRKLSTVKDDFPNKL